MFLSVDSSFPVSVGSSDLTLKTSSLVLSDHSSVQISEVFSELVSKVSSTFLSVDSSFPVLMDSPDLV